jgi:hypothetical protein
MYEETMSEERKRTDEQENGWMKYKKCGHLRNEERRR